MLISCLLLFGMTACRVTAMMAFNGVCPSCEQQVSEKNMRRHQAFCCPDLLDPEAWEDGDRRTVLEHVRQAYPAQSLENRIINLRFARHARSAPPNHRELSRKLSISPRRVRDLISRILHQIPPPPDLDAPPLEVIYEDASMIAINKPAGVPVTPTNRLRSGSPSLCLDPKPTTCCLCIAQLARSLVEPCSRAAALALPHPHKLRALRECSQPSDDSPRPHLDCACTSPQD